MGKKDKEEPKEKNAGKKGQVYKKTPPIIQSKASVSCSRCGNSFPCRLDDTTTPIAHYIAGTTTYCK